MTRANSNPQNANLTFWLLEPAVHGMGAPQAGRRDHREAITLFSWLVVSLTTMSPFVVRHARASWFSMGCWGSTRTGYFFYFLPWDGTSTHTILDPETECTKVIQSLNNYRLTTILHMYLKTGLNLLRSVVHPFEKRLRRDNALEANFLTSSKSREKTPNRS